MKRFWILTDADATPLADQVERLFVFNDKGADDGEFYHAQSLMLLNKAGMDAHLNEVALVDYAKLSALVEAVKAIAPAADKADEAAEFSQRMGMGRLSDNASSRLGITFGQLRALRTALAAFEGREVE